MSFKFDLLLLVSSQWSFMSDPQPYFNKLWLIMYELDIVVFVSRKLIFNICNLLGGEKTQNFYLSSHQCIRGGSIVSGVRRCHTAHPCISALAFVKSWDFAWNIFKINIPFLLPVEQTPRIVLLIAVIYPLCFYLKMSKVCAHFVLWHFVFLFQRKVCLKGTERCCTNADILFPISAQPDLFPISGQHDVFPIYLQHDL